jgi:predicted RNA-binding Zn ribbon-like protein
MASSGKKKTTMAKLMRETRLRERKAAKAARKDDRKRNASMLAEQDAGVSTDDAPAELDGESVESVESVESGSVGISD